MHCNEEDFWHLYAIYSMRQFNFVSLDILYTCSSAVDINLDIEIAYFILFCTFVDILYVEVHAKCIIHAHICLLHAM
jgi:hypothetical protein